MIENLTDLFLYEVAPDLNITGGGGFLAKKLSNFWDHLIYQPHQFKLAKRPMSGPKVCSCFLDIYNYRLLKSTPLTTYCLKLQIVSYSLIQRHQREQACYESIPWQ